MLVIVQGYNHITSKKDSKKYTLVHGTSDIPFSNGKGYQNYNFFMQGHIDLDIGTTYEAEMSNIMVGDKLEARVIGLH